MQNQMQEAVIFDQKINSNQTQIRKREHYKYFITKNTSEIYEKTLTFQRSKYIPPMCYFFQNFVNI